MNFRKKGGGVTPVQKKSLQILAPPEKKAQHRYPKRGGGGGQRPFGLYPKIHPIWKADSSLREGLKKTGNLRSC